MPKSKHRRKPGGKAVAHPGRGKPGQSLRIDWPEEDRLLPDVSDLPLWQASEELKQQWARDTRAAYEQLAPGRLPPELVDEYRSLQAERARLGKEAEDLPDEQEKRLAELERAIAVAIPDSEVLDYLVSHFGYGLSERSLPAEVWWDTRAQST